MDPTTNDRHETFLRLLSLHQRHVHAYLGAFLRDPADIDDVLQETSIVLWRKFDQYDTDRNFLSGACGVARLEMLKFCRTHDRAMLPLDENVLTAISDVRLEMSDTLDARREALTLCLGKLRSDDRDLIERCYASDKSTKRVAEDLQRPVNSVYKSLTRIRRVLGDCITRETSSTSRKDT